MLPLARAAIERGHEVRWAVPPDGVGAVVAAGIEAVPAGPVVEMPGEAFRRHPELLQLPPVERFDGVFAKLFGAILAPALLADLLLVALSWRPQLVVCDAGDFAGHVVAAELGIPSVTKGFGPMLPEHRLTAAAVEVAPLWKSRGLEPRPYGGAYDHLYLDIYPPSLRTVPAAHVPRIQSLRPMSDDGGFPEPDSVPLPTGRAHAPLVYVTMGTVFNDNPDRFRVVLDGLRRLDVRILVTVGPRAEPATIGGQPDHIRVERYVPQRALFPHCDLVVSHGGSGTVLATLSHGLPQLCLAQGADQFLNGAALASSGAGISLMPDHVTPDAVAEAAGRLLAEPSFRERAERVAEEIAAMPGPDEVMAVLEQLV